ncbi:piggyBac transposable element-derived protein 4-like [Achroia grisella]|uniref:piggyBac transposable element-derived protein 4-like n=1 Tax=Achroia grisella TaxID=688607 RepID=UPI0027D32F41|nr:piggyBac transposable element-derived protein 4-like [Achroia grisella]
MDARKERKVLAKKLLEEVVQNLDDLSDLSGSDSEDDSCFINSIHSPSDSYLNQLDDNLIEQRLEHIFGFGLTGDKQDPPSPPMQTQQISTDALLTVLDETSHFTNTPKTDNSLLPTHLGTETEQCYDQPSDVHTFNEVQQNFDVIDAPMEEFLADDGQESETNNEVRRDRSQPRVWEIKSETHEVPLFEKRFKPKANDTHKTSPLSIFERLFPDELMVIIVEQTNRYARQKNSTNWKPVTLQDIKAYLGVLILMGLNPLPDMELYWSSDPFYYNKEIAQVFPIVRFKKITENLHLNDNEMEPPRNSPEYDKLFKLRPLLTKLNKVYQREAYNSEVQSIDECMVKFKGRSSLKQYMPKKPIKRGFKVWARCDAKTGYLYQFEVYSGKGDSTENEGLGYNVVMKLCSNVPRNTLIAFDNFFTSCNLMEDLYDKNIYAVGTVRCNRKDLPDMIKKKQPKPLRLDKHQFSAVTAEPITAIKWLDTKEVTVLTTAHQPLDTRMIKRTQKDGSRADILCPAAIASYTLSMGGVDLFDHFRSSYPINRKSRKYWMRLFFFLFDASIINAYITYNYSHVPTLHGHRDFRLRSSTMNKWIKEIHRETQYSAAHRQGVSMDLIKNNAG